MQRVVVLKRVTPAIPAASTARKTEAALSAIVVYQDNLTRDWAGELWDRVGQLVGPDGVCLQSWKISDLADASAFGDAVKAAIEADVLVISVCDAGDVPAVLKDWIEVWVPRRTRRGGGLLALISVPLEPDPQAGQAHEYLEAVAVRAGLDFMPRERKLPEKPGASSDLSNTGRTARVIMPLVEGTSGQAARADSRL